MHSPGSTDDDACLLALKDVRFQWPGRDDFALSVESFELGVGEKLFLQGPSGSGKSTLLSLICGITSPQGGSILIEGTDIARLGASQADRLRADNGQSRNSHINRTTSCAENRQSRTLSPTTHTHATDFADVRRRINRSFIAEVDATVGCRCSHNT